MIYFRSIFATKNLKSSLFHNRFFLFTFFHFLHIFHSENWLIAHFYTKTLHGKSEISLNRNPGSIGWLFISNYHFSWNFPNIFRLALKIESRGKLSEILISPAFFTYMINNYRIPCMIFSNFLRKTINFSVSREFSCSSEIFHSENFYF